MAFCSHCGRSMPDGSAFCATCGRPMLDAAATEVDASQAATRVDTPPAASRAAGSAAEGGPGRASRRGVIPPPGSLAGISPPSFPAYNSPSSLPSEAGEERFLPGTVVAGRYRIIGLLGKGGMGEVYRADDLKLGQAVALKFLPREMADSPDRLQRFLGEARTALRVTHSNVCRVYDIGEVEGHHYLSMEYIDGEDLRSLLRRIGRLPEDRAVEIARQICAGLAAAHEQGFLHRDLKPANIMLDGRGKARITDFGLAGLAAGIHGAEIRSGTPSYMSPEQLAGREVTVRSDLYALGLVLYELFTGRKAFAAGSAAEMARLQQESAPATPTSLVQGLDPAVERAILQCLETDPGRRPVSALAVSAALPGGDPLAAALAAGETPSPELIAEAGSREAASPLRVGVYLLLSLLGLAALLWTADRTRVTQLTRPALEPAVLENKAREILAAIGHVDPRISDTSSGFATLGDSLRRAGLDGSGDIRQRRLAAGWPVLAFWYREARAPLIPFDPQLIQASSFDPPRIDPGMVRMWLDMKGRLTFLGIVPDTYAEGEVPLEAPDWSPLLAAAGLDQGKLQRVTPRWTPNLQTDQRAAWSGPHPDQPDWTLHVEAGAFQGELVFFQITYPWTEPPSGTPSSPTLMDRLSGMVNVAWFLAVLFIGLWLAHRNLRMGRGDRRGAFRLALAMLAARLLPWVLAGHHVPVRGELTLFIGNLSGAIYEVMLVWVLYLAVEPLFRRLWPRQMVSWVRLLAGRGRDPLVGRDIMAGVITGLGVGLIMDLYKLVPQWLGLDLPNLATFVATGSEMLSLSSPRHALAAVILLLRGSLTRLFVAVTLLVLLGVVLRRRAVAVVPWFILAVLLVFPGAASPAVDVATSVAFLGLFTLCLLRYGFLAAAVALYVADLAQSVPLTLALGQWWARGSFWALASLVALAAWGATAALGPRPAWRVAARPAGAALLAALLLAGVTGCGTGSDPEPAAEPLAPVENLHSLRFDGDDDFFDAGVIALNDPLQLAGAPFTLAAWFRQDPDCDLYARIIDKSDGPYGQNGWGLGVDPEAGMVHFYVHDGRNGADFASQRGAAPPGEWHSLVAVARRDRLELWIDGRLDKGSWYEAGAHTLPARAATGLRLGTWNHADEREWKGWIDEVAVWSTDLPPAAIRSIHASRGRADLGTGHGPYDAASRLLSWWRMEQPLPGVAADGPRLDTEVP